MFPMNELIHDPNEDPIEAVQGSVDVAKAMRLRLQGHTYRSIAQRMNVTPAAVYQRLTRYNKLLQDTPAIIAYRENEAELIDAARSKLLTSIINKADDQKTSVNNAAYAFTQLNQAGRLIRNQSTANIHALSEMVERANKQNIPDVVSDGVKHDKSDKQET